MHVQGNLQICMLCAYLCHCDRNMVYLYIYICKLLFSSHTTKGDLRLVGGGGDSRGRVEIYIPQGTMGH